MPAQTIVERFWERIETHPDRVALRYKDGATWRDITWKDYGQAVVRAGKALISLGFGHGDKIAIMSNNRAEWHICDVAAMCIGGATAAIYQTNSPEQAAYIIEHSEAKVAFVDTTEQLEKILKVRSDVPKLQKVVVFEGYQGDANGDLVVGWEDFLESGSGVDDPTYEELARSVTPEDLATFVYTSGTTGPPKAVMLTHANMWFTAQILDDRLPFAELVVDGPARALSYLPLSHIAERMTSHIMQIYNGSQTWFSRSLDTLLTDLQECKPTYFFAVPRVYEKFHAGFLMKAAEEPHSAGEKLKKKIGRKAIEVGRKVTEAEQDAIARGGKMTDAKLSAGLKLQHRVLDKIALHKIRAAFGLDECALPLSAAAPLAPELIWFFHSIEIGRAHV